MRAYLLSHPEILREVSQKLEAKDAADEASAHRLAVTRLPALRQALEHDPLDFVANPSGPITVTEFFDYRCPHCVNVAPKVLELIKSHPDVRVVFKEMPIFGLVSEHASRDALAVAKSGGNYLALYGAYMSAPALDDAMIDRLALIDGAKPGDLKGPASDRAQSHLAKNASLFNKLDLGGTPAFVIGDQIILGEDMASLNSAVAKAESGRKAG